MKRLCRLTLDEFHVQLQDIQGHLIEHVERGVASAEVVHLNDKSKLAQPSHRFDDLIRVFRVSAFRNFQMQAGRRLAVPLHGFGQDPGKIRVVDIGPGHVHRN